MTAKGTKTDPLAVLEVIDRMEVGPTRLESNRATTPYTIIQGRKKEQNEFVYKFEEEVFEPGSERDLNLAALMGAQVALNYGLFCKHMVFADPFDSHDRKFLLEALRMTAQEIFVIKFLHANPFLKGKAARLPPVKRKSYLRAKVEFPRHLRASDEAESGRPVPSRRKAAVLSSGGKESLLSFGALKEAGLEVHPLFVNESGRHWLTALNAYRYFKENAAETSRTWTNSDRMFSWMCRHLPFIREDFLEQRSDEYPIRLWTVAIFLFAVLPLVLKRGIGRIVIGDEYDTTVRGSFKGITHYSGLYDQSRYFDNSLSRFFSSKGWKLSQFSVVRPLSELLVETILSERYPELWRHQVSCHATHKDGERIFPCGKCEKCRRVVGMLMAIGADPAQIGYSEKQQSSCLRVIEREGVQQEKAGAEHMAFLLNQAGLVKTGSLGEVRARERPEVLQLRFDSERSPANTIPVDLRKSLYRIFLKHARGAVKKSGRLWNTFDLLRDKQIHRPYPFESASEDRGAVSRWSHGSGETGKHDYLLGDLSWPEAKERLKQVDIALLPVGSVEQHGPHLPLDTDAFDAEYLARSVAAACKPPRPLVLPLVPYGVAYHHADFSGTMSVSPESLYRMVYDIGLSAGRNGVTKLVIVNGHGGNTPALQFAAQMINRDAHIFTCVDTGETSDADLLAFIETPGDVHAGEAETSTALATRPELVRLDKAEAFVPKFSSRYLDFSSRRSVEWYTHTAKISPTGVLGDPTRASREKGQKMWRIMIANLVEFVEHLKGMSLDEIYQRRY